MALTDDLFPTVSQSLHGQRTDPRDPRHARNKIRRGLGSGRNLELQTASIRPPIFHAEGSAGPNRLRDFSQHTSASAQRRWPMARRSRSTETFLFLKRAANISSASRFCRRRGAGLLQAKFEALKRKLEAEGLFAPERKRPLPKFPARIGIVTSPSGAAIRDMLNVLRRRAPGIAVLISPVRVQGRCRRGNCRRRSANWPRRTAHWPPIDIHRGDARRRQHRRSLGVQ